LRVSLAELTIDDLRTAYERSRPPEEALCKLERRFDAEGLAWLAGLARIDDLAGFRDMKLSGRVALNTLRVVPRRARRIVDLGGIAPTRACRSERASSVIFWPGGWSWST
jgi:hypothetical protein